MYNPPRMEQLPNGMTHIELDSRMPHLAVELIGKHPAQTGGIAPDGQEIKDRMGQSPHTIAAWACPHGAVVVIRTDRHPVNAADRKLIRKTVLRHIAETLRGEDGTGRIRARPAPEGAACARPYVSGPDGRWERANPWTIAKLQGSESE